MEAQQRFPLGTSVSRHFQLLQTELEATLDCERVTIWLIDYNRREVVVMVGTDDIASIKAAFVIPTAPTALLARNPYTAAGCPTPYTYAAPAATSTRVTLTLNTGANPTH